MRIGVNVHDGQPRQFLVAIVRWVRARNPHMSESEAAEHAKTWVMNLGMQAAQDAIYETTGERVV